MRPPTGTGGCALSVRIADGRARPPVRPRAGADGPCARTVPPGRDGADGSVAQVQVPVDEGRGGRVLRSERVLVTGDGGRDLERELLAELDAPLVEAVDAPHDALDE